MIRLCIRLVLFILMLTFWANANVSFEGDWTFDRANSEFGEGGDRFVPVKLQITQSDSDMTIERTYQREFEDDFIDTLKFSLDGKENHSTFWKSPRVIVANWANDEKSLTIITTITFSRDGLESETTSTDIWRILDDGATLSRDFALDGPWGLMRAIYVFTKAN